VFLALGALWFIQFAFAWRQSRDFMRAVRELRRLGRVAIGMGRRRPYRRVFVALATDDAGRVVGALVLSGWTVFARPRSLSVLDGVATDELAAAVPTGAGPWSALPPQVLAAATQAAGFLIRSPEPHHPAPSEPTASLQSTPLQSTARPAAATVPQGAET
jgi:glucitol operon activator protein